MFRQFDRLKGNLSKLTAAVEPESEVEAEGNTTVAEPESEAAQLAMDEKATFLLMAQQMGEQGKMNEKNRLNILAEAAEYDAMAARAAVDGDMKQARVHHDSAAYLRAEAKQLEKTEAMRVAVGREAAAGTAARAAAREAGARAAVSAGGSKKRKSKRRKSKKKKTRRKNKKGKKTKTRRR